MQTSNQITVASTEIITKENSQTQNFVFVLFVFLMFGTTSIWIMQNSINAYYQQTYHEDSPIPIFDDNEIWQLGGEIGNWLYSKKNNTDQFITRLNDDLISAYNT